MSNPSLILPQSPAYGEDYVYAAQVEDGAVPLYNVLPLTFTRASGGTRINKDGLVQNMPYNLLTYSEEFSNAVWNKLNSTITINTTTAPNGTITADSIVDNTTTAAHRISQTGLSVTSGTTYTLSVYIRKGSVDYLNIAFGSSQFGANGVFFDLTNFSVFSVSSGHSASITNEGSGWYRVTFTANCTSTGVTTIFINPTTSNNSPTYIGNGSTSLILWGAQVNIGSTAQPYLATTDRLNMPRITYPVGGGCGALLLEPQRTNLVTYSEQFDNAGWTKTGVTISSNATTSPDGTTSADKIIANAISGDKSAFQLRSITTGQAFTISAFFKKSEYKLAFVRAGGQTGSPYVIYNLDTQAVVSTSGASSTKIEDYGNGWYRILFTLNSATGGTCAPNVSFLPDSGYTLSGLNVPQYTGDGTSGGFVWGCQLEANGASYATSYIPTTSSSATRVVDACSKTGISSLIGQTEGVFFYEFDYKYGQINTALFDTSSSNTDNIYLLALSDFRLRMYINVGGVVQVTISTPTIPSEGRHKVALAYKENDCAFYLDGVQVGVDTSCTIPTVDDIYLRPPNQNTRQVVFFKTRLTDAECQTLTTL
jgi:hypothetical protein